MSKRKPEHPQRPSNTLTTISLVEVQAEEKKEVPDNKALFSLSIDEIRAAMREKRTVITEPTKDPRAPIIFNFILDASGSMAGLYDELADCFNTIIVPSLDEAFGRYNNPFRVGCLLFSDKLVPAWRGLKTLEELGDRPLNAGMFRQPGLGGNTALFRAMKSGILWTAAVIEHICETGERETPKGKIIVLTDGANNEEPKEPGSVVQTLDSIGKMNRNALMGRFYASGKREKQENGKVIGFFNTEASGGLTRTQFDAMASDTRFQGCGFNDMTWGETLDERRRSFRHFFGFFD